jgi:hypothetical protein
MENALLVGQGESTGDAFGQRCRLVRWNRAPLPHPDLEVLAVHQPHDYELPRSLGEIVVNRNDVLVGQVAHREHLAAEPRAR